MGLLWWYFVACLLVSGVAAGSIAQGPYCLETEIFPGAFVWFPGLTSANDQDLLECEIDRTSRRLLMHSPGLGGEEGTHSLESADLPGYFLHHSIDGVVYMKRLNDTASSHANVTYRIMCGEWIEGYCSIQVASSSDHYVKHQAGVLVVALYDHSGVFQREASFRGLEGPFYFESVEDDNLRIGYNVEKESLMTSEGNLFYVTHPALNKSYQHETEVVSLQAASLPDHHLRHYDRDVYVENRETLRNPETYNADASFFLEYVLVNVHDEDLRAMSFESVNYPGYYISFNMSVNDTYPVQINTLNDSIVGKSFQMFRGPVVLESYLHPGHQMTSPDIPFQSVTLGLDGHVYNLLFPSDTSLPGHVLLQSVSDPHLHICQKEVTLLQTVPVEDMALLPDACRFIWREAVWFEDTFSLESSIHPGLFVITTDELSLELMKIDIPESDAIAGSKASFYEIPQMKMIYNEKLHGPFTVQSLYSPEARITIDKHDDFITSDEKGRLFFIHIPGLTGLPGTVSFELADWPGNYLRQDDIYLVVEARHLSQRQDVFNQESSFVIHKWRSNNTDISSYYRLQSLTHPQYYIGLEDNNHVMMMVDDGTELVYRQTSWRNSEGPYLLQSQVDPDIYLGIEDDGKAIMSYPGNHTWMVHPGITGGNGTVSIELRGFPGFYMAENGTSVNFEQMEEVSVDDANKATFYVHEDLQDDGSTVSLESASLPGYFVRNENTDVELRELENKTTSNFMTSISYKKTQGSMYLECYNYPGFYMYFMEDEDSVFRLQVSIRGDRFRFIFPGLTGRPGTVSIQSVDNPDYFVYSAEDLTLIMAAPADDLSVADGTFYIRKGGMIEGTMSLELVSKPLHYFTHDGFVVSVRQSVNTDTFRRGAAFIRINAPDEREQIHIEDSMYMQLPYQPPYKLGFNLHGDFEGQVKGRRFTFFRPGMGGGADTVSIHAVDRRGFYITTRESAVLLEKRYDPPDPATYKTQATFILHQNLSCPECISLESLEQPGMFLSVHRDLVTLTGNREEVSTTFRTVIGPYHLQEVGGSRRRVTFDRYEQATLSAKGTLMYIVHPALTGQNGDAYSLQPISSTGSYLRHREDGGLELGHRESFSSQVDRASSFISHFDFLCPHSISFEAESQEGFYITTKGDDVIIAKPSEESQDATSSCFTAVQGPVLLETAVSHGESVTIDTDMTGTSFTTDGDEFLLVHPSLIGYPYTVSLESYQNPGHYLCANDGHVVLAKHAHASDEDPFREECTFNLLENLWFEDTVVFEVSWQPGLYLVYENSDLVVREIEEERPDTKQAASFKKIEALTRERLGPYSLQLTDNHQKIYISVSGEATVSEKNRRFYLISPGVSGRDNTVSLESADWPGKYLVWRTDDPIHEGSGENDTATKREDGIETMSDDRYSITVESKNNTLDPGTFLQRSTWHLFKSEFIHQAVSLAPAQDGWQLPVHFIRHENSQVVLDYYQPHEEFEASCSFRLVEGPYELTSLGQQGMHVGTNDVITSNVTSRWSTPAVISINHTSFHLVAMGLQGQEDMTSFQWVQSDDWAFLRDYSGFLDMEKTTDPRNPDYYARDTSFRIRQDLFAPGYFAVETAYIDRYYWLAQGEDDHIRVKQRSDGDDNEEYDLMASFRLTQGPVHLHPYNRTWLAVGLQNSSRVELTNHGQALSFTFIYPGLCSQPGTVSLESLDDPGTYLTLHDEYFILDSHEDGNLMVDACFIFREERWLTDGLALEMVDRPDSYITHDLDGEVKVKKNDLTEQYTRQATFSVQELYSPSTSPPDGLASTTPADEDDGSAKTAIIVTSCVLASMVLLFLVVILLERTRRHFFTRRHIVGTEGVDNPNYHDVRYDQDDGVTFDAERRASRDSAANSRRQSTASLGDNNGRRGSAADDRPASGERRLSRQNSRSSFGRRWSRQSSITSLSSKRQKIESVDGFDDDFMRIIEDVDNDEPLFYDIGDVNDMQPGTLSFDEVVTSSGLPQNRKASKPKLELHPLDEELNC